MKELTKDQLLALAQCADAKALFAKLTEMGIKCSEEDAKKLFDKLHTAELSDEELADAAGGLMFIVFAEDHNVMLTGERKVRPSGEQDQQILS